MIHVLEVCESYGCGAFHNTTSLVYSFLCDIARISHRKNKKIAKIMEKFIGNHLSFFTKKENKENQTDF